MRYIIIFLIIMIGCSNPRIERSGSLTIKLKESFMGDSFTPNLDRKISTLEFIDIEYKPDHKYRSKRDKKTKGENEKIKNSIDDIGSDIAGAIFAEVLEVVIKGIVIGVWTGIEYSLHNNEVVFVCTNEKIGGFSKIVKNGFNRWPLNEFERSILNNGCKIEIFGGPKGIYKKTQILPPYDDKDIENGIEFILAEKDLVIPK